MAKGNGRQMEAQERTMAEFSRIAKITSKPGYKQNRLVDKLIEDGTIRRTEREIREAAAKEQPRFSSKYAGFYGIEKNK
jgi:hypothetical protein